MQGVAAAAVNCDSVFEGATPQDPIVKTADKTSAYAGQTVTFTLTFTATGTGDNVTDDCYRVDDGTNDTLNALVTGFNEEQTNPNIGGKDAVQHVTYQIVIPSDPSLIGHDIVDRAKATSGSVESRSDLITVHIVAAPTPTPTPTPTVSATQVAPTPTTSVKGVTLGKTGSSSAEILWFGIVFILLGAALSRVKAVRSLVPAVSARVRNARHRSK
ncbi:MAG: hypothetical protein ACXVEX_12220 [Actinomycetota bacterium]